MAAFLLGAMQVWLWTGVAVAAVFLAWGIDRIDEDARGSWVFRPLLMPGIMLIWPLVLWRWWVLETGRDNWRKRHDPPRRAHQVAAMVMAVAIVVVFAAAWMNRQIWPADFTPVQLSASEAPAE